MLFPVIPCENGNPVFSTDRPTLDSRLRGDDGSLRNHRKFMKFVIPAEAGIQLFQHLLDPGFRRGDGPADFLRVHQY
jgi:hypothetical protein